MQRANRTSNFFMILLSFHDFIGLRIGTLYHSTQAQVLQQKFVTFYNKKSNFVRMHKKLTNKLCKIANQEQPPETVALVTYKYMEEKCQKRATFTVCKSSLRRSERARVRKASALPWHPRAHAGLAWRERRDHRRRAQRANGHLAQQHLHRHA